MRSQQAVLDGVEGPRQPLKPMSEFLKEFSFGRTTIPDRLTQPFEVTEKRKGRILEVRHVFAR